MARARWDVIGVGENSLDYVYRLPKYPTPTGAGAKMAITSHSLLPGGQVTTTLCACAAMGLRAKYVGAFGSDENGARMRQTLVTRGVDVTDAVSREAPNRYAVILVDEREGERIVLWQRDPALTLQPEDVRAGTIANARVVHVDDVDEEVAISVARMARDAGAQVTSDIDRCTARTEALVSAVTVPIFAEHVLEPLTGESDVERALRKLRRSHDGWLCVTRGSRGALLLEQDRLHEAPAFQVAAVDTTGAGDVFRGGFIVAMLRGDAPADVLRFANAAAAVSCTRHGAIGGVPTLEDVERLLATKVTELL